MKLLLDEMISWRIAVELREKGHDVIAIKRDWPELGSRVDPIVLEAAAAEGRAVVTNNVRDYRIAHERLRVRGADHYGIVYTYDNDLPRNKAAFPAWISALDGLLVTRPATAALLNRTHHLLGSPDLRRPSAARTESA